MRKYLEAARILLIAPLFVGVFAFASQANAQAPPPVDVLNICDRADIRALPADQQPVVCQDKAAGGNPLFGPDGILTKVINIISILVGIASVIMVMIGGFKFITSGNTPQNIANARETVIYAILGLIVAISAQVLVRYVLSQVDV